MIQTAIYWFNNDLRIADNPALQQAALHSQKLICVCWPEAPWTRSSLYPQATPGAERQRFREEALTDLSQRLSKLGQTLYVIRADLLGTLKSLIAEQRVDALFRSVQAGEYENRYWHNLGVSHPGLTLREFHTHTLFRPNELPFDIEELPSTFSGFRKRVEKLNVAPPLGTVVSLPPAPKSVSLPLWPADVGADSPIAGGESAAERHVRDYFADNRAHTYKETRNALDDWNSSTKFSPWLALGCVSAKTLVQHLRTYERTHGANDSSYWIYFELLWREYFQWYAHKHRQHLYRFSGIGTRRPLTSFYPERFRKWCRGETPYPLVNACMKQLLATGYMSNRGRQIAASCLIHELKCDWRYGAAFFEQHLLDYDVASNWGNWQYIAGVGADPRGGRHFNIDKQAQIWDPNGEFINRWAGAAPAQQLDSVDYHDWPISPK
ncbi:DASH family cryptochrome [Marinimicrobium alkaliphilum]|uniref:DASH family cryptochrome n=1 Tax=Marinimicrobium alkaliphilum TaxID=2202654 RepID=UPI000DB98C1C|nr:DASH family cryptochrome [Marinimicrobium alkaliphilum]